MKEVGRVDDRIRCERLPLRSISSKDELTNKRGLHIDRALKMGEVLIDGPENNQKSRFQYDQNADVASVFFDPIQRASNDSYLQIS